MNAIRPQTLVLLYRQTYLPPARSALPHCWARSVPCDLWRVCLSR